jgi:hypothetical protein
MQAICVACMEKSAYSYRSATNDEGALMLTLDFSAMLRRIALILVLAVLALGSDVTASLARQVGTAVVNDRIVILDSDGTWKYKDEAGSGGSKKAGCETLEHIELCLEASGWKKANLPGDFIGSYTNDGKYFVGIVYEPSGSNDGYTYDFLQKAIIQNATSASDKEQTMVPVLDSKKEVPELEGFHSITYSPTINGASFVFHNIFKIYPDHAVQFAFWTIGREYTNEFRDEVTKFTKGLSFPQ